MVGTLPIDILGLIVEKAFLRFLVFQISAVIYPETSWKVEFFRKKTRFFPYWKKFGGSIFEMESPNRRLRAPDLENFFSTTFDKKIWVTKNFGRGPPPLIGVLSTIFEKEVSGKITAEI